MGAKLLSAIIAGILGVILFRSLKGGRVSWGVGREAFSVERSKNPVSYWIIILFEFVLFIIMAWGAFILPGLKLPSVS